MRAIDDFDGPNSSPYDRHVGLTSQACFSCLALAFPVPVLGLTSGVGILRAIRSMETKEVPDRGSLIVRNGAGRGVLGGQYRDGMAGGPKTCLHGSARTICKKRKQANWQWRRPGVPVPGSFR